jgi:hypothetical protein
MTDEESVLGNLPRSRPGKRSEKRDRSAAAKPAEDPGGPGTARPANAADRAAARAEQTGAAAAKPPPGAQPASGARPRPAADGRRAAGAAAGEKPPNAGERSDGDPVGDAIRATARLAGTGARVAGTVAQEVLRRIPRP